MRRFVCAGAPSCGQDVTLQLLNISDYFVFALKIICCSYSYDYVILFVSSFYLGSINIFLPF